MNSNNNNEMDAEPDDLVPSLPVSPLVALLLVFTANTISASLMIVEIPICSCGLCPWLCLDSDSALPFDPASKPTLTLSVLRSPVNLIFRDYSSSPLATVHLSPSLPLSLSLLPLSLPPSRSQIRRAHV